MELFDQIGIDIGYVVLGIVGFSLILLVLVIVNSVKYAKLKKRYESFMLGEDGKSLEKSFSEKFQFIEELKGKTKEIDGTLEVMQNTLHHTYQKIGIVKYDAFKEMGGELSFALALLTDMNDGFIINSMHSSREGCFTYIKEIKAGACDIILAEEEKKALEMAKNYK